MAFKKPVDKYDNYTKREEKEKLEEFRENFDREDEKALISAALRTFMPMVFGICAVFIIIGLLITLWLS